MDLIEGILDKVTDVLNFDLAAENVHGIFSNLTLLTMILTSLSKDRPFPKTNSVIKEAYDYIIVGGGPAGSVLANRLSEMPCVSVLLLEAGGDAPLLTEMPSAATLFYKSNIDWKYEIESQKKCCMGQKENKILWNSGKALGGGSVLNAMLYVRGNKKNYDMWAAEGCTGWSYDEVLPYFKKLEDNRNIDEVDKGYHRQGGPMTVEKPNYEAEIKRPIIEALTDMGFTLRDINGEKQTGIYDLQATIRNQQRCSTAKAYMVPAEDRPNLDIVKNAFVTKIIIADKRAVGVEVDHLLKHLTVRAEKEVIVSNGAVRTPQLLMLSGIGPKEELEKFNIDVVADLPVGKNLQDHYASSLLFEISSTIPNIVVKSLLPTNILDYVINRHGPNTSPNQVSLLAFLDGNDTRTDFPMQELYFAEYSLFHAIANYNLKDTATNIHSAVNTIKPMIVCYASLLNPYSKGEVTLKSTDPYDQPRIDPHYYEDERDFEEVLKGMKICRDIGKHPALRKIKAKPFGIKFPACEKLHKQSDNYLVCMTRHLTHTFWHPVGTARMGSPNDTRSVVDPQLRVIGVDGLRVVNAAVMPIIPSGNTNVPTMMVAEKAADIIKENIKCGGTEKRRKRRCKRKRGF